MAIKDAIEDARKIAYHRGYLDGLEAYAWIKEGVYYVGTSGRTLKEAKEKAKETYNYKSP